MKIPKAIDEILIEIVSSAYGFIRKKGYIYEQ